MKVVINKCYGGFGLSKEALIAYYRKKGKTLTKKKDSNLTYFIDEKGNFLHTSNIERDDEDLIEVIEELGVEKAASKYAKLKIVEIPDDTIYEIEDYDGMESIYEVHASWD